MAVFGAPIAHEDHARRACYAALQMLDDVADYAAELRRGPGLNFSTRIGINSGEVVAGAIGQRGDGEYTAIGHTVGLAQRMEALAEPGKAYVTEHTAELAAGFLDLDDLGEFEIKGASRPVRVFELAGVGPGALAPRPLARRAASPASSAATRRWRRCDAALAEAEAGRGGSRSASSPNRASARAGSATSSSERCRAEGLEVFEAQAQAHGTSIPFMPVLQMLRAFFGIGERDTGADRRARRSPVAPCCSTRPSPRTCRCCSTSSASPTRTGRCRR